MIPKSLILAAVVLVGCKEGAPQQADTSPPVANAPPTPTVPPASAADAAGLASPVAVAQAADASPAASAVNGSWGFDADKMDAPPLGFSFGRTGSGRVGRWVVVATPDAPSKPNVLAQLDADPTDYRFPVAVADGTSFKDVKLSVSCRAVSGKVDQGCGLVWRFRDPNNYYLARANALEDNVRLYRVVDGQRIQFASWTGKVSSNVWHKLRVEARGERFEVYFDDKRVMDAKDVTFGDAGKIGVWTKADSVIQFDDLSATSL